MKKHIPTFLTLIACVLLVLCMGELSSLQSQVNQLSQQNSDLRSEVVNISNEVRATLEEEASILTDEDWQYGDMDTEALTVPFTYTVSPKTMTPGVTTATLIMDDVSHPMTENGNGSFSVTLSLPAFQEFHAQRVVFETNGVQSIQLVDFSETPFQQIGSFPHARCAGSTWSKGEEICYKGTIELEDFPRDRIGSLDLVLLSNGKEIDRQPLDPAFTSYYSASAQVEGSAALPETANSILYVDVTDANGLRYRLPVLGLTQAGEEALHTAETIQIYSAQGDLLWSGYH